MILNIISDLVLRTLYPYFQIKLENYNVIRQTSCKQISKERD